MEAAGVERSSPALETWPSDARHVEKQYRHRPSMQGRIRNETDE